MTYDEVNNALMGGGGRSAVFKNHGDQVWGEIINSERRQQIGYEDGLPLFWDAEMTQPKMQIVIFLQTDEQDDDEDDGVRKVYVKEPSQLRAAMRKAVTKAGARGISNGGKLLVRYMSDAEPKKKGMHGQKQYFCKYEPPTHTTVLPDDEHFDDVPPPDDADLPF